MGVSTHATLCFGVELDRAEAVKFHARVASLAAQAGHSLEGFSPAAIERALGWLHPRMRALDGACRAEWLDESDMADRYAVGMESTEASILDLSLQGTGSAIDKEAKKMAQAWQSSFGPALASIGVEREPRWIPVAWAG